MADYAHWERTHADPTLMLCKVTIRRAVYSRLSGWLRLGIHLVQVQVK
jgi:hypothetical protein